MATYSFATITAAQAAVITEADRVEFDARATATTVIFGGDLITITVGVRGVTFDDAVAAISRSDGFTFSQGGRLLIGDAAANTLVAATDSIDDAIFGGDGADTLDGGSGANLLQGNAGNDMLIGRTGPDTIYGGQGDDRIEVARLAPGGAPDLSNNFVQGNKGNDTIQGGNVLDTLLGGQGNDSIAGEGVNGFLNGNLGDDTLTNGGYAYGEDGNDRIEDANFIMDGGAGVDTLIAEVGPGRSINGGEGNDYILVRATAGGGNTIDGGTGNDFVFSACEGDETINGGADNDDLNTTFGGRKLVDGGSGDDSVSLGFTSSTALGGAGNDILGAVANTARHSMDGGEGNDTISGRGLETMNGGAGDDLLNGDGGGDVMIGGSGADIFNLGDRTSSMPAPNATNTDRVLDWSGEDRIRIPSTNPATMDYQERTAASFNAAQALFPGANNLKLVLAAQVGADVFVFTNYSATSAPDVLMLVGRSLADIDASSFVV